LAFVVGTVPMKVQLIVVQGKPEGKTIPLLGPRFKIGRGETCHLRPNSEQVSREHAEFAVGKDGVTVNDLGSRNGTLVNGRAITAPQNLKNGDLVQVGPLTFAVSISGMPEAAKPAPVASTPGKVASLDDVSNDEIDSWLISDKEKPTPESPSGVYGGDTITISAFKDAANQQKEAPAPAVEDNDEEYERLEASEEEQTERAEQEESEDEDEDEEDTDEMPDEFIDESNPFYVKKKKEEPKATDKQQFKDTSDAATEILRKMMERRKQKD
jgi:pSer/pThr/pTyr-binding forkhead associated (FHA) protein